MVRLLLKIATVRFTSSEWAAGWVVFILLLSGSMPAWAAKLLFRHPSYPVEGSVQFIAVGDFNADGHADLAVTTDSDAVSILLGRGDMTFLPEQRYGVGIAPGFLLAGQLASETAEDLVVMNSASSDFSVLLGQGDGSFDPEVRFALPSPGVGGVMGSFNLDAHTDLAVALPDGRILVFLGSGQPNLFDPPSSIGTGMSIHAIARGDFNEDGR